MWSPSCVHNQSAVCWRNLIPTLKSPSSIFPPHDWLSANHKPSYTLRRYNFSYTHAWNQVCRRGRGRHATCRSLRRRVRRRLAEVKTEMSCNCMLLIRKVYLMMRKWCLCFIKVIIQKHYCSAAVSAALLFCLRADRPIDNYREEKEKKRTNRCFVSKRVPRRGKQSTSPRSFWMVALILINALGT